MNGYALNSLNTLRGELAVRYSQARDRAFRWKQSHGEIGCYGDLDATVRMFRALLDALNEWEQNETGAPEAKWDGMSTNWPRHGDVVAWLLIADDGKRYVSCGEPFHSTATATAYELRLGAQLAPKQGTAPAAKEDHMTDHRMKLWVVGETSPNPDDWSIWREYALVLAPTAERACEISDRSPATEIPMDKELFLVGMTEPNWGDDT